MLFRDGPSALPEAAANAQRPSRNELTPDGRESGTPSTEHDSPKVNRIDCSAAAAQRAEWTSAPGASDRDHGGGRVRRR